MTLTGVGRRALLAACVAVLAGCASYTPIPEGYTGPRATLWDTAIQDSTSTGHIYAAVAIDDNRMDSAFSATRNASYGQGFRLSARDFRREVPARPMRVTLRGGRITAAPIHALFLSSKGELPEGEAQVDWTPEAGKQYVVRGNTVAGSLTIWIEEAKGGPKVTPVLTLK